jgi:mono/diheme cytochrome c family protein
VSRRVLAFLCAAATAHAAPDFTREVLPLLEKHCFDCHGDEKKPKGGVNLERFGTDAAVMADREVRASVFSKVESHQMPPPKRDAQPTDAERAKVLAWIADLAARPDPKLGARDPGRAVLRRLTRLEYNNTVRDLFGLKLDVFVFPERLRVVGDYFQPGAGRMPERVDVPVREYGMKYAVLLPDAGLPGGNRAEHGFHNRGEAMNLSPLLLEKYVALGRAIVESPKLAQQSAAFRALIADPAVAAKAEPVAAIAPDAAEAGDFKAAREFAPNLDLPLQATTGGAVTVTYQFRFNVDAAAQEGTGGVWDATARDRVVKGGTPVRVRFGLDGRKALLLTPRDDLWVAGFSTAEETSGESLFTNQAKGAKTIRLALAVEGGLPGEGVQDLALCALSREKERGPVAMTVKFSGGGTHTLSAELPEGAGKGNTFFAFRAPAGEHITELQIDGSKFSGNYVLLDDLGFITATPNAAPPPVAALKMSAREKHDVARERLGGFLARAFRRPVDERTVARYAGLYDDAIKAGAPFSTAMREALAAALASPDFLYLAEPVTGRAAVRALDDNELANRLAYFLWSAPPDDALRAARLREPAVLAAETRRMLRDPRVRELAESFAVQWLRLDQLYTAKPDPQLFRGFYYGQQGKRTLHGPMLVEALLPFDTVLVEDRSVLDFVNADYIWLNRQLAKLYGLETACAAPLAKLPPASADELKNLRANSAWVRVPLPDRTRGGFVTMAGPLTVTSLPFRTSPVKRGAWLLETVFNRPPQEPKIAFVLKDAEKTSATAQSVRQKFEQHRSEPACFSCHIRLDPPGFALEAFDPIGARRTRDGQQAVDAHAEWNGRAFDGPAGFKAALMEKPEEFVRGFIQHLLSYALGRKLEIYDQPTVQEIQTAAAKDGYRFSEIIRGIVESYPFRNVREK